VKLRDLRNRFLYQPKAADGQWWIDKKTFRDGRVSYLQQMAFTVRISVSKDAEDQGFEEFFEFQNVAAAFVAFEAWGGDGEPEGWHRHVPSNRRRPDGDPSREYIHK